MVMVMRMMLPHQDVLALSEPFKETQAPQRTISLPPFGPSAVHGWECVLYVHMCVCVCVCL